MTRKLFGTDGIRGRANSYPMTPEIALKTGMAAGRIFTRGDHRHRVVIGKDTRLSGYMIEPALVAVGQAPVVKRHRLVFVALAALALAVWHFEGKDF